MKKTLLTLTTVASLTIAALGYTPTNDLYAFRKVEYSKPTTSLFTESDEYLVKRAIFDIKWSLSKDPVKAAQDDFNSILIYCTANRASKVRVYELYYEAVNGNYAPEDQDRTHLYSEILYKLLEDWDK